MARLSPSLWAAQSATASSSRTPIASRSSWRWCRPTGWAERLVRAPSPAPAAGAPPTPAPSTSGTPSASTLKLQVGKRADGDDPDSIFSDPEQTSAGSDVTYRIVIDNDSPGPVTIQSIVDNVCPGVTC